MITDIKAIDTVRVLALDMVQKAGSGHPGLPLGDAAAVYTLWHYFLRFNPEEPEWTNRDRFILSAGHGSALLYSLLYLYGYDLTIEDIKAFRQSGSKTQGHPEFGNTAGVEVTTGPLGQGFANGVGMAIAQKYAQEQMKELDYSVYVVCSDGDLMEGVASEAASIAGHLGLDNLVCVYLDNKITIEGSINLAFTEDVKKRFEAYGWYVLEVDGYDIEGMKNAYTTASVESDRPALVVVATVIGKDAPGKANCAAVHGSPLSSGEATGFKKKIGWSEKEFVIPQDSLNYFREKGKENSTKLSSQVLGDAFGVKGDLEEQLMELDLSGDMATRKASGMVLNTLGAIIPGLMGGSADLAPSCNSYMNGLGDFGKNNNNGRNIHFGIREHAMGAILNGLARTPGIIPYGSTFLVFADYMRPSIRLAALMGLQVIYIFTHDSVFLGEDGPTHQPVEHLASLRIIPNLHVIRPADGAEVREAWIAAIRNTGGPTALILTRQAVKEIERGASIKVEDLHKGGYVISESKTDSPVVSILATGSEVEFAMEVKKKLNVPSEVISIPCVELFMNMDEKYRDSVIRKGTKKVVIEAASSYGWAYLAGADALFITQDDFGMSAPLMDVRDQLGFTVEAVVNKIEAFVVLDML